MFTGIIIHSKIITISST